MSDQRRKDLLKLATAFFDNLEREKYCEYGGWGLDDKRPFGNSDVEMDILEIIEDPCTDGFDEIPEDKVKYANSLYNELGEFLKSEWKKYTDSIKE